MSPVGIRERHAAKIMIIKNDVENQIIYIDKNEGFNHLKEWNSLTLLSMNLIYVIFSKHKLYLKNANLLGEIKPTSNELGICIRIVIVKDICM